MHFRPRQREIHNDVLKVMCENRNKQKLSNFSKLLPKVLSLDAFGKSHKASYFQA